MIKIQQYCLHIFIGYEFKDGLSKNLPSIALLCFASQRRLLQLLLLLLLPIPLPLLSLVLVFLALRLLKLLQFC